MSSSHILLIDDEEPLRKLLSRIISLEGFTVSEARTLKDAKAVLEKQPFDVVLCDVRLPDGNGVEFVKRFKHQFPTTEIILLTAFGNIADGVQAIKNGAFDYITKGDDNNRIIPLLHQAVEQAKRQQQSAFTIKDRPTADFSSIIGHSKSIQNAISLAKKIAPSDATVLLLGETGTGKEVFANAIHENSKRKTHPIVAINCGAFSRELLEGELFGHKAGAYTGATKDKKGLVEAADGGTLFLDEIGELPIDLQAKLLRLLENGEFIKLGDTKVTKTNVRIIAATNRELLKEIEMARFREDLYYRLNVFSIELPSLKERPEDIESLANFFLSKFAQEEGRSQVILSKEAAKLLTNYSWRGNIRELKNIMSRAVILADDNGLIEPAHLPYQVQQQNPAEYNSSSLANIERKHIQKILQHTNGNKAKAARILEIGLATLYRKLEEYQISTE